MDPARLAALASMTLVTLINCMTLKAKVLRLWRKGCYQLTHPKNKNSVAQFSVPVNITHPRYNELLDCFINKYIYTHIYKL